MSKSKINFEIKQVKFDEIDFSKLEPQKYYIIDLSNDNITDIYYEGFNEILRLLNEDETAILKVDVIEENEN